MYEILKSEQADVDKMTESERAIYCMSDNKELAKILSVQHTTVKEFFDIASTLNELHTIHHRFNEVDEDLLFDEKLTDKQKQLVEQLQYETFNVTIAIGNRSVTRSLICMDECDALYHYLSIIKLNAFYFMLEHVDIHHLSYYLFELNSD